MNVVLVLVDMLEPPKLEEPPVPDEDNKLSNSISSNVAGDGEAVPLDSRAEDADLPDEKNGSDEGQLEVDDLDSRDGLAAEEEVEEEEEEEEKLFERGKGLSLRQGLTTGHFDALDVKLLRTCSEPDLHKLSLSQQPRERDAVKLPVKSSGDVRDEGLDDLDVAEDLALVCGNQCYLLYTDLFVAYCKMLVR